MTLATLTLTRPAGGMKTDLKTAAEKPAATLAALLKADSARSAKAADKTSEKTETAKTAATSLEDMQKERRSSQKAQARAQVIALMDRIRLLKQFAADNPKVMAQQLAAIVKELKSAIKAYSDAGGSSRDLGSTASASAPAPTSASASASAVEPVEAPSDTASPADPAEDATAASDAASAEPPSNEAEATATVADTAATSDAKSAPATVSTPAVDPRNIYEKMRDEVSGSEAAGDMDFVKMVRGVGKVIRELLTKAKIQTALKGPDDETKKAFKETEEGLKDVDKALEKMDREIRNSSPAAGMFVALYA